MSSLRTGQQRSVMARTLGVERRPRPREGRGRGLLRPLAGGTSPYDELSVLVIVWASATHPPARVAAVVAVALGGGVAAVLAHPTQSGVEETLVHLVIWSCLAGLALTWTAAV